MAAKRKGGRPPKLTKRTRELVLEAIAMNGTLDDAADLAGIHRSTLFRWIEKGEQKNAAPLYRRFRDDLARARVRLRLAMKGSIAKAATEGRATTYYDSQGNPTRTVTEPGDWRAAAWWLARMYPAEFADKSPLFLLHRLRELAATSEGDDGEAWGQLCDVIARGLAKIGILRAAVPGATLGELAELEDDDGEGAVREYHGLPSAEDARLAMELVKRARQKRLERGPPETDSALPDNGEPHEQREQGNGQPEPGGNGHTDEW